MLGTMTISGAYRTVLLSIPVELCKMALLHDKSSQHCWCNDFKVYVWLDVSCALHNSITRDKQAVMHLSAALW